MCFAVLYFKCATPFVGLCFGHAKWYANDNAKVYYGFSKVDLKGV
jgi:hypothetical protein